MPNLKAFQAALYDSIPLVKHMQLNLQAINPLRIMASAPIKPNINDKATVFGGSSAALMTICGWSLLKYHLESHQLNHDVVIHQSKLHWDQAQADDMSITAELESNFNWSKIISQLSQRNRATRIKVKCAIMNQAKTVCSHMTGSYVILKNST